MFCLKFQERVIYFMTSFQIRRFVVHGCLEALMSFILQAILRIEKNVCLKFFSAFAGSI
jgi:hypothetical protein